MADIKTLETPDFLQNNDIDDIHDEMFAIIPDKYDKSEAQHLWNFTRPTAAVASQLRGFDIPRALSLIWPQFTNDIEYMRYHAETRNMKQKEALYAVGEITFTGTAGTTIPAGYRCSTESKNDIASKDYITLEDCKIGESGTVTVKAQANIPGMGGNTAANTIVINSTGFEDVTGITNEKPFTGGVEEESLESLLERIQAYDRTQGDSNIGNPSDYKRWAESVPGTGSAKVIRATDKSGLVTIILTDGNGDPATTELCESVYNFIMSPNDDNARYAPCGAFLKVIPPTTATIIISGTLQLTDGSIQSVITAFVPRLKEYFREAIERKEILYHRICNILGDIDGVYDFRNITINGDTANISLADGVFPTISENSISFVLLEE